MLMADITLSNGYLEEVDSDTINIHITVTRNNSSTKRVYFDIIVQAGEFLSSADIYADKNNITIESLSKIRAYHCTLIIRAYSDTNSSYTPWYKITNDDMPSSIYPTEYYPPYYPTVGHQWVWDSKLEAWNGQADDCVACALSSLKEIHEYKEYGQTYHLSVGWIYGNRKSTDRQGEGMDINQALDNLQSDGVPIYSDLPGNNDVYYDHSYYYLNYPDNYYYDDYYNGISRIGAKTMVSRDKTIVATKAIKYKINSWSFYDDELMYTTFVQGHIIDDGGVIVVIRLADNFYDIGSDGIVPYPDIITDAYHALIIIGWKLINGTPYWIVHNNWDITFGDNGICYMPFDYVMLMGYYLLIDNTYVRFQWDTPKQAGRTFNLTAAEWNKFTVAINQARSEKGLAQIPFTQAVKGNKVTASIFNEAVNALNSMISTGVPVCSSGDTIYASYLNDLVTKLNQIN